MSQQVSLLEQELQAEQEKITSLRSQLKQRELEMLEQKGKQNQCQLLTLV